MDWPHYLFGYEILKSLIATKTVLDIIKNCNNMYCVSDNEIKFDYIHSYKRWKVHDWMEIVLCVKIWATRLPSLSHPPLSMRHHRRSHPPPAEKCECSVRLSWRMATGHYCMQVRYNQYQLACQKSQRSMPYNMIKSGLTWSRIFRRRHLGRGWLQSPASDGSPCIYQGLVFLIKNIVKKYYLDQAKNLRQSFIYKGSF